MKIAVIKARKYAFGILFGALLLVGAQYGVYGQIAAPPTPKKVPPMTIKVSDLAIMDIWYGDLPDSVYIQIGNVSDMNVGAFTVRFSLQKKGETKKTDLEKRILGLKAKTDLPLTIRIGQPIKDLEIGIFIDAKKEIPEKDEKNCGKLFPNGDTGGSMPCEGF